MLWNGLTPNSFWYDQHRLLYNADCRSMADLPDESVQMVVTSPPYWGLRKYSGLPDLIWGGDEKCEHKWNTTPPRRSRSFNDVKNPGSIQAKHIGTLYEAEGGNQCSLCGAWKGAYGLEPTPEMYVQHTIEILREVRRVLRKDGVVFWNIGDSYCSQPSGKLSGAFANRPSKIACFEQRDYIKSNPFDYGNLKPKDLCLIPFRVAIAAQEDNWYVRSVIIWAKNNPMPESVTDRPTESHEYILMLTKSARYYWDAEAVRTKAVYPDDKRRPLGSEGAWQMDGRARGENGGKPYDHDTSGANLKSVWSFPTQGFPGAHFATYPEKLVEICVKAATPEVGCCSKCGKPWVRIMKLDRPEGAGKPDDKLEGRDAEYRKLAVELGRSPNKGSGFDRSLSTIMREALNTTRTTLGWQPSCSHKDAPKVGSIVLDPFAGSGTTLKVAAELNRRAIGYELSEEYCKLIVQRNKQSVMRMEV